MKNLLKMGGIAALIGAATNLMAIVTFITLGPKGFGSSDPGQVVAFLANNQAFMRVFDIISYLVFGVSLIFLSLALYERLKAGSSPALAQAVTAFGLIYAVLVIVVGTLEISNLNTVVKLYGENPAQAATVWLTLNSVASGLGGGGGETLVNALWILLLSCVCLAGKGTSQSIELLWPGYRCSWNPHGSPDLVSPDGCCLWIGSYHLARLARDRHAAQEPSLGGIKNTTKQQLFNFKAQQQTRVLERLTLNLSITPIMESNFGE